MDTVSTTIFQRVSWIYRQEAWIIQTVSYGLYCFFFPFRLHAVALRPLEGANLSATSGDARHILLLLVLPLSHFLSGTSVALVIPPKPIVTVVAEPCRVMTLMMSHLCLSLVLFVFFTKQKKQNKSKTCMSSVLALLYFCVKSGHYFKKKKKKHVN